MTTRRGLLASVLAAAIVLGACTSDEATDDGGIEFDDTGSVVDADEVDEVADTDVERGEVVPTTHGDTAANVDESTSDAVPADVDEILAELVDAGFCDPADVDDLGLVTAMHFVVQGRIQDPCYVDGADDPRLLDAWGALTAITPTELVSDVSLVAGFEACSDCDTLAFVSALDEEASFFLLAVDVIAGTDDPDELLVTMQHELSHVFTQKPGTQLIVGDDDERCTTYHNGTGCFTDESYMAAWIGEFWPDDQLAELPGGGEPDSDDDAEERCSLDPAFTGSYAATSPEEDFAETFSAFVFGFELDPAMDDKLAFFEEYPEFVEIRSAAAAAGLDEVANNFEGCG